MGGHHSKVTNKDSTSVITDALLDTAQNCVQYVVGDQTIATYGTGNLVQGNIQDMSLRLDAGCVQRTTQAADFETKLQAQIAQKLKDQEVALTQWLDGGKTSVSSSVSNTVRTNITVKTTQNCLTRLSGTQLILTSGNANVVMDNAQRQVQNVVGQCLQDGTQSARASTDISDLINQYASYTSENPFAFITDAITAVLKSAIAIFAIIFIAIIILVAVSRLARRPAKPPPPEVAPATPS